MRSQIAIAVVIGCAAALVFGQNPACRIRESRASSRSARIRRSAAGSGYSSHFRNSRRALGRTIVESPVVVGNNVDGPIAGDNGTVLFANNDASNVMQMDSATGLAGSFGIVFYGGWGTPSARNRIIAIPTIAQGYTGRAK